MSQRTVTNLICDWLWEKAIQNPWVFVKSHEIQTDFIEWVKARHDRLINPETASRKWRVVREQNLVLAITGNHLTKSSKETSWIVSKIKGKPTTEINHTKGNLEFNFSRRERTNEISQQEQES